MMMTPIRPQRYGPRMRSDLEHANQTQTMPINRWKADVRRSSIALTGVLFWRAVNGLEGGFHVSPTGNDANAGSPEKPFATLARAQAAARRAKGGIVTVHSGTFRLPATLAFTPEDSGTEYRSADDGPVIVNGGTRRHPAWTPHGNGIFALSSPQALSSTSSSVTASGS